MHKWYSIGAVVSTMGLKAVCLGVLWVACNRAKVQQKTPAEDVVYSALDKFIAVKVMKLGWEHAGRVASAGQ